MTAHLLRQADIDAVACGNLGTPLIEFASDDLPGRRYIAELSSFQLEGIERLHPRIAVLTNLSADHLDRYESLDAYAATKGRIFSNQVRGDDAVVNADDPIVMALASQAGGATQHRFSTSGPVENGAWVANGALHLSIAGKGEEMLDVDELPVQGLHNVENALAASLTATLAGACLSDIEDGLRSFRPLPHRMEFVLDLNGVAYNNDSKATNVGATQRVVESLGRMLVLIMGGRDKGGDFSALADVLPKRVRHVVLMGEARGTIAQAISDRVPVMEVENLAEAVEAARIAARPGDAVLLAPACASFDAYGSFEERGEHFRQLVLELRKNHTPRSDHPRNRRSDG
jgi:UDP-N-acetylmuramoylalanine--D-glutamate ligase